LLLVNGITSDNEIQLFAIEPSGERLTRVARGAAYQNAAWAPDGRSIAFRRHRFTVAEIDVSVELGLMTPDGEGEVILSTSQARPGSPGASGASWSLDGETLAYTVQIEPGRYAVWLVSRYGGGEQRLLPELEDSHYDPSWSPIAESELAFVSDAGGVRDIWRVDVADPAGRENLTRGSVADPRQLRWSPDGTRLAFSALDTAPPEQGGGDREIYFWDAQTAELTRATDDDANDVWPTWSPDGAALIVGSDRPGINPITLAPVRPIFPLAWYVPLEGGGSARWFTPSLGVNAGNVATDWFAAGGCAL
jgi:Tol biopolymer transport system component